MSNELIALRNMGFIYLTKSENGWVTAWKGLPVWSSEEEDYTSDMDAVSLGIRDSISFTSEKDVCEIEKLIESNTFIPIFNRGTSCIDNDNGLYNEVAHIEMICYLLENEEARTAFKDETGVDLGSFANKSMMKNNVSQVTEHEKELFYKFVVWATENRWNEPGKVEDIRIYKTAKEYLQNLR